MTDKPTAQPDKPPSPQKTVKKKYPFALLPVAIGVLLGIVLIVVILAVAIRSFLSPDEPAGIPLEVTRIFTTSPSPTPSSPTPPLADVGGTQVPLPSPTLLEVGGHSFSIQVTTADEEGNWAVSSQPEAATWIFGTVINYVLALEPTADNQETLEGLQQGDPILLSLSSGTRLTFRVKERQEATANDPELFSQFHPGLTLILPREEELWLAVSADFEAAVEPTPAAGGTTAGVGQAVQVGDARVTVTEGSVKPEESELQPGTMIYVVEFAVTNTGATPLDPEGFLMELLDGLENRYLLSSTASEAGRYGPLSNPIEPGQEVNGSAGYVVPDTLAGPNLTWTFSPEPGSELHALFTIPYTPETSTPPMPEVDILDAFLDEDEESLHVVAEVYNDGDGVLTVTEEDVSLSSSAGPAELRMAAPPFPWTIAGGDSREVELMFAQPDAATCVVTILGYTFEISGLP